MRNVGERVLVQSLNLGPIWQASDSLSPRAPRSSRRPFLKFAPEPSAQPCPVGRTATIGQVTSSRDSSRRSREAPKIAGDAEMDAPIAQRCQLLNAVHLDKENLDLRKILAECTQAARQHRGRKRRDVRATFSRPREPRAASRTR